MSLGKGNSYVLRDPSDLSSGEEELSSSDAHEASPTTSEPDLTTMEDDKLDAFLNQLKETEDRLENELKELQEQYPTGMTLTPSTGSTPTPSTGAPKKVIKRDGRSRSSSAESDLSTSTSKTDPSDSLPNSSSIEPGQIPEDSVIVQPESKDPVVLIINQGKQPTDISSGEMEISTSNGESESSEGEGEPESWTITSTGEPTYTGTSSNTRYVVVRSEEYDPNTEQRLVPLWKGRTNKDSLYINPFGLFWFIWNILALLFSLYLIQSASVQVAFNPLASTVGIIVIDYLIDVFFIIDVILLFFVAHVHKYYYLVTDSGHRMNYYLSTWFFIDFIAAFPWDVLVWAGTGSLFLRNWVRLFKYLWIFRLYRALHYIFLKIRDTYEFVNPGIRRMIGVGLFIFIACTIFGSLWLAYGLGRGYGSTPFAPSLALLALSRSHRYLYGFYWAFYSFVDPSSLRHTAILVAEIWFSLVMGLLAFIIWALIIATLVSFFTHYDRHRRRWFAANDKMNFYLRRKDMYQNLVDGLHRVPIFSGIASKRVFSALARKMKLKPFPPNVCVIREGHVTNQELYFIQKGIVDMSLNGSRQKLLGPGEFFGETGLLKNFKRQVSIHTVTYCEFLVLERRDLVAAARKYPVLLEMIRESTAAGTTQVVAV